jgi:hypothetical protein
MPATLVFRRLLPVLLLAAGLSAAPAGAAWPSQDAVQVLTECGLPPIHPGQKPIDLTATPLPAAALKGYESDVPLDEIRKPQNRDKYAFRVTVLEAFDAIRQRWPPGKGQTFRWEVRAPVTDALKKAVAKEQDFPAVALTRLDLTLASLQAVEPMRARQPRRWQAHYDYALAQVQCRLAFLNEYDLALGNVRTDVLPDLDAAKGQTGFRLVPAEKMRSRKDVAQLAEEARDRFAKVATDHPNTPWAALAKSAAETPLGLRWEPAKLPDPKK